MLSAPMGSSAQHSLPHFLVIGAQRCGTTSLFHYLTQHPKLALPDQKEVHYFDRHYSRGASWYRSFFPESVSGLLSGEASPNYLLSPHAPARIKKDAPAVRLIVLLRDPIERAYSHYQGKRIMGVEPLDSFEEALDSEHERTAAEAARVLRDPHYYSPAHRNFTYVARSLYYQQIVRWLPLFDREQFLFIKSENLFRAPEAVVASVHSFLGIDHIPPSDLSPRGVGRLGTGTYPPIAPKIRERLRKVFWHDATKLASLLGKEFDWLCTIERKNALST